MMTRERTVDRLLRLYPPVWRHEYGDELREILCSRPLTAGIVADVARSALRQRVRFAAPSTALGLPSMLIVASGFMLPPFSNGWITTNVLSPTSMTFPTFVVTFMTSEVYAVLLTMCGWWTRRRYGSSATRCGVAAMRMSLIAALPVLAAGVLLALGAVQAPAISAGAIQPLPLAVLLAPLAHLPKYWLFGAIGGALGKRSLHQPIRA
jgi:hypothetical protein